MMKLIRTAQRAVNRAALVAAAGAGLTAGSAQAAITWTGAVNGNWDTGTANWIGDATSFTDNGTVDVIFDKTTGGTITISANMSPLSTTVNSSGNYTFSGGPIDSGTLVKTNSGTLTLSASNAFSSVTLNSGAFGIKHNDALGTGPLYIYGGTFTPQDAGRTITPNSVHVYADFNIDGPGNTYREMKLGTNAVTLYNGTRKITSDTNNGGAGGKIGGAIGDGGNGYGLTKDGDGVLYLDSTASTYSGKTTVLKGALTAASIASNGVACALGRPTTVSNGTIDLYNGTTFTVSGGGFTDRIINLAGGAGTYTIPGGNNSTILTLNGDITATGTGAKIIKFDLGSGTPAITVGGVIQDGSGTTTLYVTGGRNNQQGNIVTLKGVNTFTGPIINVSPGNYLVVSGTGQLGSGNYAGNITNNAPLFQYDSSANQILSGVISGTGALTMSGAGTLTLSGTNTYAGATTVSKGTLKAGIASVAGFYGAFGTNSAVSLSNVAGVTLDITGYNTEIGSLTGGGTTGGNVTLGSATLTIGRNNTSPAAFAGVISGVGGSLVKIGTGTNTLSGVNTYTGNTTVNAGMLTLNTTNSIGSTATLTIADGAMINLPSGITTVNELVIGSKKQAKGVWGVAGNPGVTKPDPSPYHFTGPGVLKVLTGSSSGTLITIF